MSQPLPNLDGLRIARENAPRRRSALLPVALAAVAAVLVAGGTWWYSRSRAVEVRVAVAREAAATSADPGVVLNASGYVVARREATVSSKVTGRVAGILIEEGMTVTEGQVLARLDDTNVRASFDLAQAQVNAARAALGETRAHLREAELDLKRQRQLRTQAVAAQAELDRAEAATDALRARLEQQQAELAVAERNAAVWQQQLDDMEIRAPFAGTVTSKNAQPGEMISPMSTGGFTRTGICTIVDMQSLEIEIDVNESYINRVRAGQPVEATLDAYPEWRIPCHVVAIIPTADRNKSTVRVRIGFEALDPRILPEMSAKVGFREAASGVVGPSSARRGVLVPRAAVISDGGRAVVLVVSGSVAERRAVTVAAGQGEDALVTAGLAAGERVILRPPPGLTDGTRVDLLTP
ncbi:efflux RND transporter periplasmic adaptor subunit [Opitutus sp. ER46]|uniref:efflux RND transporter periplasmic adaptor subunit n=1 Tax=Opitutus sp. ER46 TaxID=2161864 RepID=UPI000D31A45D|nr:efflux RND transporter periplasmic adaptor subunit [Opitutus sp. ER46]PTX92689.1 efflux RND transporter periplasmic adaptor subunit [Opitutus sp. ER46]